MPGAASGGVRAVVHGEPRGAGRSRIGLIVLGLVLAVAGGAYAWRTGLFDSMTQRAASPTPSAAVSNPLPPSPVPPPEPPTVAVAATPPAPPVPAPGPGTKSAATPPPSAAIAVPSPVPPPDPPTVAVAATPPAPPVPAPGPGSKSAATPPPSAAIAVPSPARSLAAAPESRPPLPAERRAEPAKGLDRETPSAPAATAIDKRELPPTPAARAESRFRQGAQLLQQGRPRDAEASFLAALADDPGHLPSRQTLLGLYL